LQIGGVTAAVIGLAPRLQKRHPKHAIHVAPVVTRGTAGIAGTF
jgi:hypothetical protein